MYYEIRKKTIAKNKIQESGEIELRKKNRNSIENIKKLPQFTTMNVIDGQAGIIICSSLIFYSLTIDNILNIIVLLILAAVSIATLTGENGILTQAGNSKTQNEIGKEKEEIGLAYNGAKTEKLGGEITAEDLNSEFTKNGVNATASGTGTITVKFTDTERSYKIDNNGTVSEFEPVVAGEIVKKTTKDNYTDGTNSATIPAGFTVSNIPAEQNISSGLVIYDIPEADIEAGVDWTIQNADGAYQVQTLYNQFVWIPVASADLYERDFSYPSYYDSNIDYTPEGSTFTDISYLPSEIQPTEDTATANEVEERASVVKYNGFYIARYEAGDGDATTARSSATDGNLVSKQNVWVYNYITQTNSKTKAKTMYTTGDVRSSLCSGIQWDMVMKFVDGKNDANGHVFDVRTVSPERHSGSVAQTGKDNDDKVQNIYDLEGNCYEWVAEKNNNTSLPFVFRGGGYDNGSNSRASLRTSGSDGAVYDGSFRPALYIM